MLAAELYYSHYQEKEKDTLPVVLIHGAAGNHLSWGIGIRRLKGFRVFALDLPGHGKSAGKDGMQTIHGYAQAVVRWLDAINLRRAVFVGHSMGGAIAMELGIRFRERVLGLGLIATGVRLRVHPDLMDLASRKESFYKAIEMLVTNSFSPQTPCRLVELASQRMAETRPSVLHGDLLACTNFDVKEEIDALRTPVLVVCGTQDKMTPLRYAQYMADTIPNARLQVIPDSAHMLILERPAEVATVLDVFLQTIDYFPGEEV
jgi:pimeloyl-ACP methyl ester carboxylesterase